PRSPQEELLLRIWKDVLHVEKLGIHNNFFETGGDSIMAIQVIARASRAGYRLSPAHIFQYQTIAALASVVGSSVTIAADEGVIEGPLPLTPVQRRFFEDTTLDPHHFKHAFLLEVHNPLEAGLLKAAVRRIVSHHDALRMRFERDAYGWHQTNANLDEFPVDH